MRRYIRRTGDINITTSPTCPEKKVEYRNSSNSNKNEKKKIKFDFKKKKDNTLRSLHDVEHFLSDFKNLKRYIKLYFLLK